MPARIVGGHVDAGAMNLRMPFLGSEAIRAGLLTVRELASEYRNVYRNVYLDNEVALTPLLRARAAWLFAGPDAVLSGLSAAAVHGTEWLDVNAPAEVVRANRHAPAGLRAHSYALAPGDICVRDGMRVTTEARTAFDLGRLVPYARAVPMLDALMNKTGLDPAQVWPLIEANGGTRGVYRSATALVASDGGAASPLETQTRLALGGIGIPGLETDIPFYDQWGLVWARAAMGWRRWKLAVECDDEREYPGCRMWVHAQTAELESRGWTVVWVTRSMASHPASLRARVRKKVWAAAQRERSETERKH